MGYKPFLPQLLNSEGRRATGATGATEIQPVPDVAAVAGVARVFREIGIFEFYDVDSLIKVTGEPAFWPFDTWIEFEERAANLEYCEELNRNEAECLALVEYGFPTNGDTYEKNI